MSYPERPPSLDDREAVADYVQAYEESYRWNVLHAEQGCGLEDVQIGVGEPRFFESPPESVIARVSYTYGFRLEVGFADSRYHHVSYYVDDSVVVRAEEVGPLEEASELEPDPLVDGTVLECFE